MCIHINTLRYVMQRVEFFSGDRCLASSCRLCAVLRVYTSHSNHVPQRSSCRTPSSVALFLTSGQFKQPNIRSYFKHNHCQTNFSPCEIRIPLVTTLVWPIITTTCWVIIGSNRNICWKLRSNSLLWVTQMDRFVHPTVKLYTNPIEVANNSKILSVELFTQSHTISQK